MVLETEGAKGFRRGRNLEKTGMKGQDTSELFFDDARVQRIYGGTSEIQKEIIARSMDED